MSSPGDKPADTMPAEHSAAQAEHKSEDASTAQPSWEELMQQQGYERMDEKWLEENPWFVRNNVVHDTLRSESAIADYKVYVHPSKQELVTVVHFGEALAGHPGVVHGGIISTIFDNSFGWLYFMQDVGLAYTANLKVDFRKPLFVNSTVYVHVKLHGVERRKLIMEASMETVDRVVHAESSTIFVIARKQQEEQGGEQAAAAGASTAAATVTAST